MFPDSPYAVPVGSFPIPQEPPTTDPTQGPFVCWQVNRDWLPFVVGAMQQLLLQTTWLTDIVSLDVTQARVWSLIFSLQNSLPCERLSSSWSSGGADTDLMIRQDPENPCLLQSSVDGVNWCTFVDISKCTGNTSQPGSGGQGRPTDGQSNQDCYTLQANQILLLPFVVYPGDVLQVLSANGAGNDGGTEAWYCVDGEQFFAGACVGFGHNDSGDPLPSVNHMRLIYQVGSAYVDAMGGAITVGGTGQQQVTLQVNDSALANNSGSYKVCVELTNNQSPTGPWSYTFDFTLSSGGWIKPLISRDTGGVWTAGQGWQGEAFGVPSALDKGHGVQIARDIPSSSITSISVLFDYTKGSLNDGEQSVAIGENAYAHLVTWAAPDPANGSGIIKAYTSPQTGITSLNVQVQDAYAVDGSTPTPGTETIRSITVTGTGTNPFTS